MTLLAWRITSQRGPYTQKAHIYSSFYFPPIPICQSETQRLGKQKAPLFKGTFNLANYGLQNWARYSGENLLTNPVLAKNKTIN